MDGTNEVTGAVEEVAEVVEEVAGGIDLAKFGANEVAGEKPPARAVTIESLTLLLEKAGIEKKNLKDSFDKKAREKAAADKKARAAEEKAAEPMEELAKLQRELENVRRDTMKSNLSYTLSKEWGVSDELTGKMVRSIFSEETGSFVEDDFREAQLELIKSVRNQAKKEGYEERDVEVMNGKPRSVGGKQDTDVFADIVNKYARK